MQDLVNCDAAATTADNDVLEFHMQSHDPLQAGDFSNARAEANRIRDKVPIWGMLPMFSPPMCPMDALVVTLVEQRKKHGNFEDNDKEFANTNFPSVNSLLNPVLYESDKPVASTIARHVASVIRVHTTPEKIAVSAYTTDQDPESDLAHLSCYIQCVYSSGWVKSVMF